MNGCKRLMILLAAVAALSLGVGTSHAWAWWSSSATATASAKATTVAAPTLSCNGFSVLTLSTSFTWTAVTGATSYTFFYAGTSKTVTGTSTSVATLLASSTAWVVANVDYGSTTWSSVSSNTRSYWYLGVVGSCQ